VGRVNARGWIRYAHHKSREKIRRASLENQRQINQGSITSLTFHRADIAFGIRRARFAAWIGSDRGAATVRAKRDLVDRGDANIRDLCQRGTAIVAEGCKSGIRTAYVAGLIKEAGPIAGQIVPVRYVRSATARGAISTCISWSRMVFLRATMSS
jgi:hypothetical protein